MPIDPVTASALISGTAATGSFAMSGFAAKKNRAAQKQQNAANAYLQREMYDRSRKDAIADRDYENFYNSPKQLMTRLKEAGINPRLAITGGNSFTQAANTRQASTDTPEQNAPQLEVSGMQNALLSMGEVMSKYVELTQTQAQTDNLRETRELIELKAEAEKVGIDLTRVQTKTGEYNLDYAKRTENMRTRKAIADIAFTEDENARKEWLINEQKLKLQSEIDKIAADARLTNQQRENLQLTEQILRSDAKIREMEAYLNSKGMTLQNNNVINALLRVMNQAQVGKDLREIYKK